MKATQMLHDLGQRLWLHNITRNLLTGGTLRRYRDELSVRGLTPNPTIFDHALKPSTAYDAASTTWRPPRRSCGASSGASPPRSGPRSAPSPRCSSADRGEPAVGGAEAEPRPEDRS